MWITSKLWNDMHAPEDVEPAIKDALANLQLDYLDLYLVHWPIALKKGVFLPETAEDMQKIAALDQNLRLLAGGFWEVSDGPYSMAVIWDE